MRKERQKWQAHPRAGGPHEGIAPVNMPWEIYLACSDGERINTDTYEALHETIDLDGLYDLLEMRDVLSSWKHAQMFNSDWQREHQ